MPEGDTVLVVANRLHAALAGERLLRTDLRVPAFAAVDLSGQVVRGVAARGKHLLLRTDARMTLHTHLRMDGRWELRRPNERLGGRRHEIRCVLTTEPWTAVGRRLPVVEVIPTRDEHAVVGHLGPDVLGPDWDPGEVLRRLRSDPHRAIGDALIDQRVMAGPGNVYRSEICFLRGLDPWTPVGAVPDLAALVELTKRLMEANRRTGAQVTTGDPRVGRARWVYGRAGEPCRRCGERIRVDTPVGPRGADAAARVTFWCPSCPSPSTGDGSTGPSISGRSAGR
jgi:formamidopyrimidine-DNA glycosylase